MTRLSVHHSDEAAPRLRSPIEIMRRLGESGIEGRATWGEGHPLSRLGYDADVAPGEVEMLLRVERAA